jgi:hypothetical protein
MPGSDGLPYEVYKVLWPELGELLLDAVNAAVLAAVDGEAAAGPPSWREGIITLIYKGKGLPRDLLSSYRPITLLNCDWKITSKASANRFHRPLGFVVSPNQTAFVRGREIAENVLHHLTMAQWLQLDGRPAALAILDLEQAYDRVDRPFTLRTATAMGFGPGALAVMSMALAPSRAAVSVNGHLSTSVEVLGGLPQGDALSPLLWNLQLEPLTAHLQQLQSAGAFASPTLPDGRRAPASFAHADDTKLLVCNADADLPAALGAVDTFCRASNARRSTTRAGHRAKSADARPWAC